MGGTDNDLVLFWKRQGGVRCVAQKRPPGRGRDKRWELRVLNGDRLVKRELFQTFRGAMRAAATWREDFGIQASGYLGGSSPEQPQPWHNGPDDVHKGQNRQDDVT
jgi:hypothetical protein